MSRQSGQSPVSYKVFVNRLPEKGMPVLIEADEDQRRALAEAHDLLSVERFAADLMVERWKRDGVRISGRVRAAITQACVVTLDPVESAVDEEVTTLLVPEDSRLARDEFHGGEIIVDAESDDLPEPFSGDRIDVGALAEEFFALGIDPYPRNAAAESMQAEEPVEEDEPAVNPLRDALSKLKQDR